MSHVTRQQALGVMVATRHPNTPKSQTQGLAMVDVLTAGTRLGPIA
jgi:hypothetical protein